jgi:hypothetical protein
MAGTAVAMNSPAETLLARETRVRYGAVPVTLDDTVVEPGHSSLVGDAFLLRTEDGLAYFYRKGDGITIERSPGASAIDEALWLNGSVYAAVASINGFMPIHASAVALDGKVYAFTGPSGAGKSMLIAGLGARGLPMFCDDTLVLDVGETPPIMCLPGHKRLKLAPEALAVTGAEQLEAVGADTGKHYARPAAGDVRRPLPLAMLVFLEQGPEVAWHPITGAERFTRLRDDHYTADMFARARQFDTLEQFGFRARLAKAIPMARFVRPRDVACFQLGLDCVIDALMNDGGRG